MPSMNIVTIIFTTVNLVLIIIILYFLYKLFLFLHNWFKKGK
ncbi:unknown transmembrane protein [Thermoanaerobacterium thermosaccharolyticum DSM 571]|uniref:Uncharacterized protein n=1 Tax=Thermoanaerobacterium thermosaccharolyticum (strain ATCC 7956 / DSM 571 / NCIMB 9385 / NCA 3814 / NCTC 13789 / WDCM 00135 / 2032) TaxID=580327 RepID=D9TMR6_THETC|nr:unknown transmembrane protein [Thermoanaerobacterium thermosaccharolyticum DSM 571]